MILEALQHIFTPAPKPVKAAGYVYEAIAIEARYKRCRKAWQPHLEACRREIINAAENLPEGAEIMILGSGGLYDVPMGPLIGLGYKLTLIDIVHLPKTKKPYRNIPEVAFVEKDVTGRILGNGKPPDWPLERTPPLIISLNLLSQLPLCLPDEDPEGLMKEHLDWLKASGSSVLLISDIERQYHKNSELTKAEVAIPDMPEPDTTWDWNIAPNGEATPGISIVHKVGCWRDF